MNRLTNRRTIAAVAGTATTAVVYGVLYSMAWIPGWLVLVAAGIAGVAVGRALGLARASALPTLLVLVLAPSLIAPVDLVQVLIFGIAALGLYVLLGLSGQLSLAQGTMLGIGAYTTAILASEHGWPVLAAIPAGVAVTGLIGWLLGLVAVRFDGVYLAILTGAFAIVAPILLKYFADVTGGVHGISIPPLHSPIPALTDDQFLYLLVLAVAIVAGVLTWNIARGPVGFGLRAMHDSPVAARGIGISLGRAKMQAFLVSSLLAGLAGGLYSVAVGFVSPDSFGLMLGIHLLVMGVIGGTGSIVGAFIGAGAVHLLQTHLEEISVPVGSGFSVAFGPQAVFGIVLILVLLLMPTGLSGLPQRLGALFHTWHRRTTVTDASLVPGPAAPAQIPVDATSEEGERN
ncbi:branched-chain amino acid ABC transporter permease [Rhodococcus qingshengii]|uniref:branched-chain amino acid ABC transporter permease n=1 Tax=Rhodococcus qingshengii TaxID=334542 RepID=UPI001C24A148|nr:branched-chain amino acid ABC transporter permease [Rhodococcus qingshengii]QXC46484.1 branched-chain amino acid ABC transporter permease [Rhodococcus qingshengii]